MILRILISAVLFAALVLSADESVDEASQPNTVVVSTVVASSSPTNPPLVDDECSREMNDSFPKGPLIPCHFLDLRWIECDDPKLHDPNSNSTTKGCPSFGGASYEKVPRTNVTCTVLPCIECLGKRSFIREVPCIKYTGHYFLSTLLYSMFLGIIAVDRFCLGYSAVAVGKLMTLGGLGLWWLVDIFLLVNGNLRPADDSNWEPYY